MRMTMLAYYIGVALSEPRGRDIATIFAYWRHMGTLLPQGRVNA